jgi:hypothetical protein
MTHNIGFRTQDNRKTLDSDARRLISCVFCLAACILIFPFTSLAQVDQADAQIVSEPYHESALRRFEIIFTTSLPFTALHSYLTVRSVGMIRQQKVSPKLEKSDWNAVGGLTILFSGFVAFWDWRHTRGEDISENPIKPRRPIGLYSGYSMFDTRHLIPISRSPAPSIQHPASNIRHLELTLLSGRF